MVNNMNIGKYIKQARQKLNMTQEDLSNKVFVSPQAVSKWERNESIPDILTFIRLSQIFQISIDDLVTAGKGIKNLSFEELQNLENVYSHRLNLIHNEKETKRVIHKEEEFDELVNFDFQKNTKDINGYKILIYDFYTYFNEFENKDITYVLKPFVNRAMENMKYDVIFVSSISKYDDKKGTFILTISDKLINLGFNAASIMKEIHPYPYPNGKLSDSRYCSDIISHIVNRKNIQNIEKYFMKNLS